MQPMSPFRPRFRRLSLTTVVLLLVAALLGACGTKGSLTLPPPDNDDSPKRRPR